MNPLWDSVRSTEEIGELGRAMRRSNPRAALAELAVDGRDPLAVLDLQNSARIPELVPIREERMAADEFSFFRGGAAVMAADLAAGPHSGILVPSCGDAHVANFGFYASPQRTLVFDINDFDEAAWAPWEWDVKRLVTSIIVAGSASGRSERVSEDAGRSAIRAYQRALAGGMTLSPVQRYFTHYEADAAAAAIDKHSRRALLDASRDAMKRTGERAVRRLAQPDDTGRLRFIEQPPTTVRLTPEIEPEMHRFIAEYRESARLDVQLLLDHYVVVDAVRRVVGVGSVGTRCGLVLFQDGDGHALILQAKQAEPSVLQRYGRIRQPASIHELIDRYGDGARAVAMQRTMQAFSDPFLGYLRADDTDMYVRQFHDLKGGIDATLLEDVPFVTYARACAIILARAHLQSQSAAEVLGYVGRNATVEDALFTWSLGYAELVRTDFRAFVARRNQGAEVAAASS